LLAAHGVTPTKSLGQNFVIDPNTIRKTIAASGVTGDDHVLEIGPGAGSLTVGLASVARKVTALEVDERLIPLLGEVTGALPNVEVVHGDVLSYDLHAMAADVVVANLPYNIAAQTVLRVLESAGTVRTLTVMTQKEVGERLSASAGSKIYGQTSVMTSYYGTARVVATVSRRAFWPVPGVDSVIVRIERGPSPDVDRVTLFRVIKAAFGQRRKTLRQSLAALVGSADVAGSVLESVSLSPSARAEELSLEDFVSIAQRVEPPGT
jgi:16S rRNA (adenine1518-N6/adenine1519-N6)-dimethyltransferase